MKQLMVARQFPTYHPRAGEPTFFVERIWESIKSFAAKDYDFVKLQCMTLLNNHYVFDFATDYHPKHHTIRAGNRWKTGDMVELKVWSGRPYNSKTITITQPLELTVFDVEINKEFEPFINNKPVDTLQWELLAKNDGLSTKDFLKWFIPDVKKFTGFSGQILSWNPDIKY